MDASLVLNPALKRGLGKIGKIAVKSGNAPTDDRRAGSRSSVRFSTCSSGALGVLLKRTCALLTRFLASDGVTTSPLGGAEVQVLKRENRLARRRARFAVPLVFTVETDLSYQSPEVEPVQLIPAQSRVSPKPFEIPVELKIEFASKARAMRRFVPFTPKSLEVPLAPYQRFSPYVAPDLKIEHIPQSQGEFLAPDASLEVQPPAPVSTQISDLLSSLGVTLPANPPKYSRSMPQFPFEAPDIKELASLRKIYEDLQKADPSAFLRPPETAKKTTEARFIPVKECYKMLRHQCHYA